MEKIDVVKKWFQRVWSEEDTAAIHEMFSASAKANGLGARPILGPTEFEAFQQALLALIQDVDIKIEKTFQDGEWICVFCKLTATNRKNGEAVELSGCTAVRIVDEVIVEGYNHFEFMTLFEQLGQLPQDCFAKCLKGQVIPIAN